MRASSLGHRPSVRIERGVPSFAAPHSHAFEFPDPTTRLPILIFTRSQPRNLLSIARSNNARRKRPSRSRKNRMAHICRGFSARFAPTFLPAFQARRSCPAGSYCESPIAFLLRPPSAGRTTNDLRSTKRLGLSAGWQLRTPVWGRSLSVGFADPIASRDENWLSLRQEARRTRQ
jgi:hypothetical protein